MIATGSLLWYVNRASGVVMLVLLTTSMVLGIVTTMRWRSPRWPRFITAALHQNVSLMSVAFLGIHVFSAVADGYAPIGWKDAVVPFVSQYRPLWIGLGAVVLDLLAAIVVTSLFRERLGARAWKLIHWSAYACWPIAFIHGLGAGSDVGAPWMIGVDGACLLAVGLAASWRFRAWFLLFVSTLAPSVRTATRRTGARQGSQRGGERDDRARRRLCDGGQPSRCSAAGQPPAPAVGDDTGNDDIVSRAP